MPWKEMSDCLRGESSWSWHRLKAPTKGLDTSGLGVSVKGARQACRAAAAASLLVHVPHRSMLSAPAAHPAWGARLHGGFWTAGMCLRPCRPPVLSRLASSIDPAEGPKHRPGSDLNTRHPTTCGRWTSKATSPLGRCHPLTVLDDHSRFALGLQACGNEQGEMVQQRLTAIFRRYGLPNTMLMDNGSPGAMTKTTPPLLQSGC